MKPRASLLGRLAVVAALLIPAYWYVKIPLTWDGSDLTHVTGDEPHYLIIADAIARDHSVDVKAAYDRDAASALIYGPIDWPNHVRASTSGTFSLHGIGLPLILAPAFGRFGLTGARVFLAGLTALLPFLFYGIARSLEIGRAASVGLSLSASFGLPFLCASGQVYPDLPTGIILLALIGLLMRRGQIDSRLFLAAGLLLGLLPWLHIKNLLPMGVFTIAFAIAFVRREHLPMPGRRLAWLLAPVVCSLTALALYNLLAFGHVTGPYSAADAGATLRQAAMIGLGLHLDQAQGLFMQQPLFLLAIAGLPLFIKRMPLVAWTMVAAYVGVIMANALHPCWYGCASFSGRFMWSVAAFWFVPLAVLFRELRPIERIGAAVLGVLALAWQFALMVQWRDLPETLYTHMVDSLALRNSLLPLAWRRFFPSFYDFDRYLDRPANILAIVLLIALTGAGVWLLRQRRGDEVAAPRSVLIPVALPLALVVIVSISIHARTTTSVDLLGRLSSAELRPDATPERFEVGDRAIATETRHTLITHAPSRVTWIVTVPEDVGLEVWIAVDGSAADVASPVSFGVGIGDGVSSPEWKTWSIDPRESSHAAWLPIRIDLGRFAGRQVAVIFSADQQSAGPPGLSSVRAYWASPRIHTY